MIKGKAGESEAGEDSACENEAGEEGACEESALEPNLARLNHLMASS